MSKSHQLIRTADGSTSIYLPELDETYHSKHGAEQESRHVFVQSGLEYLGNERSLKVLEVGMGTGLNVLLSWEWAVANGCEVQLHTLEPFPIPDAVAAELDFGVEGNRPERVAQIHQSEWGKKQAVDAKFSFIKHRSKLLDFGLEDSFDLVFYDAFGPNAQAEMWDAQRTEKLAKLCKVGAILVTYCSQGQFRRNLKASGFEVEKIAGPPGKWEMVRAVKK